MLKMHTPRALPFQKQVIIQHNRHYRIRTVSRVQVGELCLWTTWWWYPGKVSLAGFLLPSHLKLGEVTFNLKN